MERREKSKLIGHRFQRNTFPNATKTKINIPKEEPIHIQHIQVADTTQITVFLPEIRRKCRTKRTRIQSISHYGENLAYAGSSAGHDNSINIIGRHFIADRECCNVVDEW